MSKSCPKNDKNWQNQSLYYFNLQNLGFGTVDKINLGFESAWWPKDFKGFNMLWEDYATVRQHWDAEASVDELLAEHDGVNILEFLQYFT